MGSVNVRGENPAVQLVTARPWPAHTAGLGRGANPRAWDEADAKVSAAADYCVVVSQVDAKSAISSSVDRPEAKFWGKLFSVRNAYMVDHADKAIGVWDTQTRATCWEGHWIPPEQRRYVNPDWAYYVTHTYDWSRKASLAGRLYGSGTGNTLTEALCAGCDISVYALDRHSGLLTVDPRLDPSFVETLRLDTLASRPDLSDRVSRRQWRDDDKWKQLLLANTQVATFSNVESVDAAVSNLAGLVRQEENQELGFQ